MKIETTEQKQEDVEIHAQKQIKLIGTANLRPGHRVFEVNPKEQTCVEAQYEREIYFNRPDRRKIIIKPNCFYVPALNKKNAIKRFVRDFNKS